jgi:hypothetical protein
MAYARNGQRLFQNSIPTDRYPSPIWCSGKETSQCILTDPASMEKARQVPLILIDRQLFLLSTIMVENLSGGAG